jgi:hypothetical protein
MSPSVRPSLADWRKQDDGGLELWAKMMEYALLNCLDQRNRNPNRLCGLRTRSSS